MPSLPRSKTFLTFPLACEVRGPEPGFCARSSTQSLMRLTQALGKCCWEASLPGQQTISPYSYGCICFPGHESMVDSQALLYQNSYLSEPCKKLRNENCGLSLFICSSSCLLIILGQSFLTWYFSLFFILLDS